MGILGNPLMLRFATLTLQGMLNLPEPLVRLLGGRTIQVDGQQLGATAQLLLRLQQIVPRTAPHLTEDLDSLRREVDQAAAMINAGVGRSVIAHDVQVSGACGLLPARAYERPGISHAAGCSGTSTAAVLCSAALKVTMASVDSWRSRQGYECSQLVTDLRPSTRSRQPRTMRLPHSDTWSSMPPSLEPSWIRSP
jgi:hypothetical protein